MTDNSLNRGDGGEGPGVSWDEAVLRSMITARVGPVATDEERNAARREILAAEERIGAALTKALLELKRDGKVRRPGQAG